VNIIDLMRLLNDEKPPCSGCEHYAKCATHDLACCSYQAYARAKYNIKAARSYKRRQGHRTPSREWYEYVFSDDAYDPTKQEMPHCPHCKGVASREAA
jgi:hypothetical protein